MPVLARFLVGFLVLVGAFTLASGVLDLQFSNENYWDHHGVLFLLFITLFPRLTLLFSSVPFGGVFWWLGLIFAPRLTVAILATLAYWEMNPLLVIISWIVALSGESGEKALVTRQVQVVSSTGLQRHQGTTIEGEYRRYDE